MGFSSYSSDDRVARTAVFKSQSIDQKFVQQKKRVAHHEMLPLDVDKRECHDSTEHPNTVPVQLYLDVTGSMGHIPNHLCDDGLPTLVGKMIQEGVDDLSLMFGAIGDHECDRYPLQIAQFECGDAELDHWLTRTYLEGGGGGNRGESYLLAWYFAANHVEHHAFDKRNKKGFVFTIGDEPNLRSIPVSSIKEIMGSTAQGQGIMKAEELYAAACEKNHVFHIHVDHGGRRLDPEWKELMGQNLLECNDYLKIPELISATVLSYMDAPAVAPSDPTEAVVEEKVEATEEML